MGWASKRPLHYDHLFSSRGVFRSLLCPSKPVAVDQIYIVLEVFIC